MQTIRHQFVELIPGQKEPGILYISIEYAMAVHLCPCGCGNIVATPLDPNGWSLIYDGKTVSLKPSVGNWNFPCKSHYWIERGLIRMARLFSDSEINAVRSRDKKTMLKGRKDGKRKSHRNADGKKGN